MSRANLWGLLTSTRNKLLLGFLVIVLFLLVPAGISYYLFDTVVNTHVTSIERSQEITRELQMMRKIERDLVQTRVNVKLIQERSDDALAIFDDHHARAMQSLDALQAIEPDGNLTREQSIRDGLNTYKENFHRLIADAKQLGFEQDGVEGELFAVRRSLENDPRTAELVDQLHEMEVSFLRQQDAASRDALLEEVTRLEKKFGEQGMDPAPVQSYKRSLSEYIRLSQGISGEGGLTQQNNKLADNMRVLLDEEHSEFSTIVHEKYRQSVTIIGWSIIVALALSIIIALRMAHSISVPIEQLRKGAERLQKGDLQARVDVQSGDELEQLAQAFNKSVEALAKADRERKDIDHAKNTFLSITSHELRSPMTPVKAQLQMLLEGYFGPINARQKESLQMVLRNADRLDLIIQDLLEVSRIEVARLAFSFKEVDLVKHAAMTVKEMRSFLPERKIRVRLIAPQSLMMECDPDRAMQVLRNLLTNAIKFSKDGGMVIVTIKSQAKEVLFSVQDFGNGISQENHERIFQPFFQEAGMYSRQYGGTGLGLTICRGIVLSQGGRIGFASEKGKGSTFYFTVPRVPVRQLKPVRILFSGKEEWQH